MLIAFMLIAASLFAVVLFVAAWTTSRLLQPGSRFAVLDHPNSRSLHERAKLRTGGLGILAGLAVGLGALAPTEAASPQVFWLAAGGLLVAAISLRDDLVTVPARYRLLVHGTAAALFVWGAGPAAGFEFLGRVVDLPVALVVLFSLLFLVWSVNLFNFMDGMDGFAAGMAAIGFATYSALAAFAGGLTFALVSLVIAAAAAGFLVFNFPPSRLFMGDVGAATLGFCMGAMTLWARGEGLFPLWVGVLVFSPFYADATVTLFRRLARGKKPWKPHRYHYYQILVQLGWGHRRTVLVEYGVMLTCAASAGFAMTLPPVGQWLVMVFWVGMYGLAFARISMLNRKRRTRLTRNHTEAMPSTAAAKKRTVTSERIYLSPPHLTGEEEKVVVDAIRSNWIAPVGPHIAAFEKEIAAAVGSSHAAAVSSGTAALHLALRLLDVGAGDEVLVSTFTFAASVNPIVYQGATPVLIDSERTSWNIDPELLREALADRARTGKLPKAVIVVHIYGQSADIDAILAVCQEYRVPLVEDAAEALGASYRGRSPGTFGRMGVFSFNGNKIITTSGGGMLVSDDPALVRHARKLASQAVDAAPHYEHSEIGYNYRMSNLLAALGRGQLGALADRIARRRQNFEYYRNALRDLPGIEFMPEARHTCHSRWLTCLLIDPDQFGADREIVRKTLEVENIESRPLWKPMHLQPVFRGCPVYGGSVAEYLFERGLSLPSGSNLNSADLQRVIDTIRRVHEDRR